MPANFFTNWNNGILAFLLLTPFFAIAQCDSSSLQSIDRWEHQGQSDSIDWAYNQAIQSCADAQNWTSYAEMAVDYAEHLERRSLSKQAVPVLQQARNQLQAHIDANDPSLIDIYCALATAYNGSFSPKAALKYLEQAKALLEQHPNAYRQFQYFLNLGNTYSGLSQQDSAEHYLSKSYELNVPGHPETKSIAIQNIGALYFEKRAYKQALDYFLKGLDHATDTQREDIKFMADLYNSLGILYNRTGKKAEALSYFQRALALLRKRPGQFISLEATIYNGMGIVFTQQRHIDSALVYHQQALQARIQIHGPEHPLVSHSYTNLASVYFKLKEYDKNKALIEQSLRIKQKVYGSSNPKIAKSLGLLAVSYSKLGQHDSSLIFLDESIALTRKGYGNNSFGLAQRLAEKGDILSFVGRYEEAVQYSDTALRIVSQGQSVQDPDFNIDRVLSPQWYFQWLSGRIDILNRWGRETKDIKMLREAEALATKAIQQAKKARFGLASRDEKLSLGAGIHLLSAVAIHANYALYELTGDEALLARAYRFSQQSKSAVALEAFAYREVLESAAVPDSMIQQQQQLQQQFTLLKRKILRSKPGSPAYEEFSAKMAETRTAMEQFWDAYQQDYPDLFALQHQPEVVPIKTIQEQLKPGEMTIEYFSGGNQYFAFWFTESKAGWTKLPGKDSMRVYYRQFGNAIRNGYRSTAVSDDGFSDLVQSGTALYQRLFPSALQQDLRGITDLTIIPDGWMHFLPFEALLEDKPIQDDANYKTLPYLVHSYDIRYKHHIQELQQRTATDEFPKPYFGFAPDYQNAALNLNFPALFGNVEEIKKGAALFGGEMALGDAATKAAFLQNTNHYAILHLGLHGMLENVFTHQSNLVFQPTDEDYQLYLFELLNLQIQADLVILSSCHSSSGWLSPGEGAMSIARAFSYAGSDALITSWWEVHDQMAPELMTDFLRQLKSGKSKSKALTEAKRNYLDDADHLTAHPYFWANFALIGNPEPLSLPPTPWSNWMFWMLGGLVIVVAIGAIRKRRSRS